MKLKPFQREDLARAALHDGLVFGLDTGLGKGLCAYIWPILKVGLLRDAAGAPVRPMCPAEPVLLVATGDLHDQIISEGLRHFRTRPTIIDSQETFLRLSTLVATPQGVGRQLPPGYYLTTYTAVSRNGVAPFPELDHGNPLAMLERLHLRQADVEEFYAERATRYQKHYARLQAGADDPLPFLKSQWFKLRKHAAKFMQDDLDESFYLLQDFAPPHRPTSPTGPTLSDLTPEQHIAVTRHFVSLAYNALSYNVGTSRYLRRMDRSIKCVYSPSLADLCADTFAVVVADEGVKIKGEDTLIGQGTRQLNPRFRLPMSGTPIKNRLPDIFRLAHWSTGAHHDPTPRFPYGDNDSEAFAEDFLVTERNLSAEDRSETGRRYVKKTPQVCNIHRLWKLLAPIVLRRRKTDCGEDLVAMHRHVVRVPMGRTQAEVYRYHLDAEYLDVNDRPALGAQLQALRIAAANPTSALLKRVRFASHKSTHPLIHQSSLPYVPKLASALSLIHEILARKEQVVVFSAFNDSLDALSARLHEAGVRHVTLDGRTSPAKRGAAAAQFKKGPGTTAPPVMLAGVECMAEGHSFPRCSNVILLAYSWAADRFIQAINRVWRLDSIADVNMYAIICEGSIDLKLESNIKEKQDAADLVLDGHLLGEDPSEVNLAELLHIAHKEFSSLASGGTIDERELVKEWPALRIKLAKAAALWSVRGGDVSSPLSVSRPQVPSQISNPKSEIVPLPNPRPTPVKPQPVAAAGGWWDALPLWRAAA